MIEQLKVSSLVKKAKLLLTEPYERRKLAAEYHFPVQEIKDEDGVKWELQVKLKRIE